jgi:hypothetical protein
MILLFVVVAPRTLPAQKVAEDLRRANRWEQEILEAARPRASPQHWTRSPLAKTERLSRKIWKALRKTPELADRDKQTPRQPGTYQQAQGKPQVPRGRREALQAGAKREEELGRACDRSPAKATAST